MLLLCLDLAYKIAETTYFYIYAIMSYFVLHSKYEDSTIFRDDLHARVQIYALYLTFGMWSQRHYRSQSFQEDLLKNLANVAIPGTGLPLSLFCTSYVICLFFVVFMIPIVCLLGAISKVVNIKNLSFEDKLRELESSYKEHLLHPDDWFSYWQINCRLTSYASLVKGSSAFDMENKWLFLKQGKEMNIPVTPVLDIGSIVCKHVNIEGGQGEL